MRRISETENLTLNRQLWEQNDEKNRAYDYILMIRDYQIISMTDSHLLRANFPAAPNKFAQKKCWSFVDEICIDFLTLGKWVTVWRGMAREKIRTLSLV